MALALEPNYSVCPRFCQELNMNRVGLLGVLMTGLVDLL